MESPAFALACSALEELTGMNRIQTRGTVRLVLRDAGLEAQSVTRGELLVLVERRLPAALRSRGIEDETGVCTRLKDVLVGDVLPSP